MGTRLGLVDYQRRRLAGPADRLICTDRFSRSGADKESIVWCRHWVERARAHTGEHAADASAGPWQRGVVCISTRSDGGEAAVVPLPCLDACVDVDMYIYIYICVCVHACMYVCMYVHSYVQTLTCSRAGPRRRARQIGTRLLRLELGPPMTRFHATLGFGTVEPATCAEARQPLHACPGMQMGGLRGRGCRLLSQHRGVDVSVSRTATSARLNRLPHTALVRPQPPAHSGQPTR